tara:strand:+ start:1310 stop:1450 length:141 start_codon:yes stop_codon:yes gene_type:complete
MKKISSKVFLNKTNKQMTITLPKKKFKHPEGKVPKRIKWKVEKIEW